MGAVRMDGVETASATKAIHEALVRLRAAVARFRRQGGEEAQDSKTDIAKLILTENGQRLLLTASRVVHNLEISAAASNQAGQTTSESP
jgi:hypothetical protein